MERREGMSTTPHTTTPAHRDERTTPLWLEALGRAPWAIFFPTCSSHWLSEVRSSRRSPQVKP
jgi:hypothetical protein